MIGWRAPHVRLAALLAMAMLIGGGGVAYGLHNLAIQLLAIGLLVLARAQFAAFWRTAPRPLAVCVGLTLALPLLQLIPLPPALWTGLPGRELAVEARETTQSMGWYGLSLDRNRTLVAAAGLIAPLAVLVLGWSLRFRHLCAIGWMIVAAGLVQFAIGVPQVLSGSALIYPENPMPGVLFGTFANRNTTGVFLVACLCLAVALPALGQLTASRVVRVTIEVTLLIAILFTQSRTAIVLAGLPAGLIVLRAFGASMRTPKRAMLIGAAVAAVSAMTMAGFVLTSQTRLEQGFARFAQTGDARFAIWEDGVFTAQKYWPAGAGMGSYDEVALIDESLETLREKPAGRAHNDYLEVVIEAGLPGLALVAAWLTLLTWWSLAARASPHRWAAWGAAAALAAFALQGASDYPLRAQATLCLAAFLILLLVRAGLQREAQP